MVSSRYMRRIERVRTLGQELVTGTNGTSPETVLEELEVQHAIYRAAEAGVEDAVRRVASYGKSWSEIGLCLQVTKQAAHKRFAPKLAPEEQPEANR